MYLDLVVVLIVIIIGLVKYKKFSSYIYLFAFTDICFLNYINSQIYLNGVHEFVNQYIPSSIYSVIVKYTTDLIETVLIWVYVGFFVVFLYYTLQILLKKK